MTSETDLVGPQSQMGELLEAFPGAQRALFRRYHIGGCSQCGFQPTETLQQVCQRNNLADVQAVFEHIKTSHGQDTKILIESTELSAWMHRDNSIQLIDVRSREEFEAVHIEGSRLMSQPLIQKILSEGTNTRPLVVVDHKGSQGLDAAAYFMGHGLTNVRCLRGGIDAWARDVDKSMKRYRLE